VRMVDVILCISALSFALAGYRQGFLIGFCAFAGFISGGLIGIFLAPKVVKIVHDQLSQAIFAVGLVLTLATIGQLLGSVAGTTMRNRLMWRPGHVIDASTGAVFGVISLLVVSWFVGNALARAPIPNVTQKVRDSEILAAVNKVMPASANKLDRSLSRMLNKNGLTQVFGPFDNERILPVNPPDSGPLAAPEIKSARKSIVKVEGAALSCRKALEGSGFVFAKEHVMTNAHVVAGVTDPTISVGGTGARLPGRVVLFDSRRDIAVIYVPGLDAPALHFDLSGTRRDSAVAAGFPLNGPYSLAKARIREEINARGPDIYDAGTVDRDVFSIYAEIEPGNSGGPLLSPGGDVFGVIFAKSVESGETGYALTAKEVQPDAAKARTATDRVGTASCV
jgi:S1-C subfamily serine protease